MPTAWLPCPGNTNARVIRALTLLAAPKKAALKKAASDSGVVLEVKHRRPPAFNNRDADAPVI
ncbi:hypothetical protein [Inquilinus sp. CAU 1745]|uniref:hypothetical protein n=1 Tax=Inquilinus sp. CAU 1745 TaxID=3140369 RepID=UPI00325BA9BE